ncbi:MAG: hypothetical protein U0800_19785 [Isosphaeraceae bacterium]
MATFSARHSLQALGLVALLCPALPAQDRAPERERDPDRAATRRERRQRMDEDSERLGQAVKEVIGQARKSIFEVLEQVRDSLAKDGSEAHKQMSRELDEHLSEARKQSAQAEKQVNEMIDQAMRKFREEAPEREAQVREQMEQAQRKLRESMERERNRLEGDRPAGRAAEQRLQDQLKAAEDKIRLLTDALNRSERRWDERREAEAAPPGRRPDANPRHPGSNPPRDEPAQPDAERRLRNFEEKLDRLMREIEQMKKERQVF